MVIRWLGAFRKGSRTLAEALDWEFTQTGEVAAERIRNATSCVMHARVGLLVDKRAVLRVYPGDVWSERDGDSLRANRYASGWRLRSRHHEAFCRSVYRAIVLKEHPDRMKSSVMTAVREAAHKYGVPVLWVDDKGRKHPV